MPEPEQTNEVISPVQEYWWAEAWTAARPRFIATATELILGIGTLSALAVFYLFSRLRVVAGIPAEDVKYFQRVDLWLMLPVFMALGLLFALETIIGVYAELKKQLGAGSTP